MTPRPLMSGLHAETLCLMNNKEGAPAERREYISALGNVAKVHAQAQTAIPGISTVVNAQ